MKKLLPELFCDREIFCQISCFLFFFSYDFRKMLNSPGQVGKLQTGLYLTLLHITTVRLLLNCTYPAVCCLCGNTGKGRLGLREIGKM